jgi:hypothetical protein
MTDHDREAALAAADGSRDAAALLTAMLDGDTEAQDVILFHSDYPAIVAVSLAAFVVTYFPDREQLRQLVTAWRQGAAGTEAGAS